MRRNSSASENRLFWESIDRVLAEMKSKTGGAGVEVKPNERPATVFMVCKRKHSMLSTDVMALFYEKKSAENYLKTQRDDGASAMWIDEKAVF